MPRGSRLRQCVARGLLLCAAIVLALIVGEIALRLLSPGYSPLFLDIYAMEDGALTLRPNIQRQDVTAEWSVSVTITAEGLRDRATPVPEDGGKVLLIGDSFAFGWGVELEQSLGYVAEEKLRPDRIRIIKAGLPGTGPLDQFRWLERFGDKHPADALVVAVFVGNDFADVQMGGVAEQYTVRDGLMVKKSLEPGCSPWYVEMKNKLKRSSMLAQEAAQLLWACERAFLDPKEREVPGLSVRDRWLWEFFQVHLKDPPPETVTSFEQMRSVLDRIHNGCVERGMGMLLVILPRSFQIYDWELQHWLESYELTPEKLDLDRPQRELTEWAKGRGVAVLDVLPALRAHAERRPDVRAYFFPNAHMNAVGHRVTGEALADALHTLLVQPHSAD